MKEEVKIDQLLDEVSFATELLDKAKKEAHNKLFNDIFVGETELKYRNFTSICC